MSEDETREHPEALAEFSRSFGEALLDYAERMRPAFEALAEVVTRPGVQAAIMAGAPVPDRPCHCLCARMHPADHGICEAANAVTSRRFAAETTGPVDVPLCAPCSVAQGVAELAARSQFPDA